MMRKEWCVLACPQLVCKTIRSTKYITTVTRVVESLPPAPLSPPPPIFSYASVTAQATASTKTAILSHPLSPPPAFPSSGFRYWLVQQARTPQSCLSACSASSSGNDSANLPRPPPPPRLISPRPASLFIGWAREVYERAQRVTSAVPHPRTLATILECGGKMHMQVDFGK